MEETMVKLPSCTQALDLQSLPCEDGVYMVRLDCGLVSLAPTSPPVWACKGRGLPQPQRVSSVLKPFVPISWLPGHCAWAGDWRRDSPQHTAQLCTEGCALVQSGVYAGIAAGWGLSVICEM